MKKDHPINPVSAGRPDLPAPPSGTSARGGSDSSPATDTSPTCPQCQAALSGEARFCHLCGAPATGPGREAVTAEAGELVAAAHHSSPKIIVVDHARGVGEAVESAAVEAPGKATGRDLLTTTPYRGLDVQCEDEVVFFTEELEQDKPDDFSDLVGRRPVRKGTGLRTTLLLGGAALVALVVAVWIIERKPTPRKTRAAASMTAEKPRPPKARPTLKPRPVVAPVATPVATMEPAPAAAVPAMNPAASPAAPAVVAPPTPTAGTVGAPVVDSMAAAAVAAPTTPRASSPQPSPASARSAASEASVADQLAARAAALVKRNTTLAVKLARAALAQKPAHAKARDVLARVYEGQAKRLLYSGANRAAAQAARRALRFGPARTHSLFYLGVALNEQRRRAEATRVLSRFLKRCPSCGYNSMYAKQLVTANRRILAAKSQAKAAMAVPPAPRSR